MLLLKLYFEQTTQNTDQNISFQSDTDKKLWLSSVIVKYCTHLFSFVMVDSIFMQKSLKPLILYRSLMNKLRIQSEKLKSCLYI